MKSDARFLAIDEGLSMRRVFGNTILLQFEHDRVGGGGASLSVTLGNRPRFVMGEV
jgi:hypothetical protein